MPFPIRNTLMCLEPGGSWPTGKISGTFAWDITTDPRSPKKKDGHGRPAMMQRKQKRDPSFHWEEIANTVCNFEMCHQINYKLQNKYSVFREATCTYQPNNSESADFISKSLVKGTPCIHVLIFQCSFFQKPVINFNSVKKKKFPSHRHKINK